MARGERTSVGEKRQRLEAELAALKQREQAEVARRAAIVGRAVLAEAEQNDDFKTTLTRILDARLSKAGERKLFGLSGRQRSTRARSQPSTD